MKKPNSRNRKKMLMPIRDERGIAIVIALLVLVLLSLLGTLFLTASMTESTISANEVDNAKAFWMAEAGLQHAKKSLPDANLPEIWAGNEDLFPGTGKGKGGGGGGGLTGYGERDLAGGSYGVQITNNTAANGFPRGTILDDPNGLPDADSDRIIVLTATGTVQGVQEAIEMVVQLPAPPFPPVPGAVVQISNGWNDMDVSTPVSGFPHPSEGSTCPDQAGFVSRGTSGIVEGSGLDGNPPEREYDSAIDDPMWDDPDALVAMVEAWMNDPAAVTITSDSLPATLGTAANPQITVWSGCGGGDFTGYGILIVDQNGTCDLNGNFEFYGLIVSMQIHPGGGEAFDFSDGTLHGALLALNNHPSPGGEATEIGAHSGEIEYSCDALTNYAGLAAAGGGGVGDDVTVLSWRPL